MKTIWEVIIVVSIALIIITGIQTVGEFVFETQTLTQESVNSLSQYSAVVDSYSQNYNNRLNESVIDPYLETDLNQVSEFVQEYRDYKGKFDQLKDAGLLIYKIPDLILFTIPFVSIEDIELYANIYRVSVWVLLLLLVIVGLKNGQLIPQF